MLTHHVASSRCIVMIYCDESSWFSLIVLIHRDSVWSFWSSVMNHHDASRWCIMIFHHDDSSWWTMMIDRYVAPCGPERIPFRVYMALFAMGTITFLPRRLCAVAPIVFSSTWELYQPWACHETSTVPIPISYCNQVGCHSVRLPRYARAKNMTMQLPLPKVSYSPDNTHNTQDTQIP